jgi:hypothetical protein
MCRPSASICRRRSSASSTPTLNDILRSPEAEESLAKLNVLQSAFWFSRFVFEGECNTSAKRRDLSVFHSHVHFRDLSDAQVTQ